MTALDVRVRSDVAQARRVTDADLRGNSSSGETAWLYDHADLWLESLVRIEQDIQSHMAKSRMGIAHLKPPAGCHPSQQYLDAKHAEDQRNVGRLHVLERVRSRKAEVTGLLARKAPSSAALIAVIARAADLLDLDEVDGAFDLLASTLERLR